MIELAAFACVGAGFLLSVSNRRNKFTSEVLDLATRVNGLKELEVYLKNKASLPVVVLHGTVGATSTVENTLLGVFVQERASVTLERMRPPGFGSVMEYTSIMLNRKEVPWYLDDGTARVYVRNYQRAIGFYDTLQEYISTAPVKKYFKRYLSDKIKCPDDKCCKCVQVLEIGTSLTVIGNAVKDKDGAPMIGHVYQVFNGHIDANSLASELELSSMRFDNVSLLLTTMGMVFLAVKLMKKD